MMIRAKGIEIVELDPQNVVKVALRLLNELMCRQFKVEVDWQNGKHAVYENSTLQKTNAITVEKESLGHHVGEYALDIHLMTNEGDPYIFSYNACEHPDQHMHVDNVVLTFYEEQIVIENNSDWELQPTRVVILDIVPIS